MVNVARGEEIVYPSESGDGSESESEPVEAESDVSRSENREAEETATPSRERENEVAEACRVVAREMYSGGLHHEEVAEKYDVPVEVVKWVMKKRGIGFAKRNKDGSSKEMVESITSIVSDSNT